MPLKDEYGNPLGVEGLGTNIYEYDWFSGSQINILIGDTVIDSAVSISFGDTQSKTPVYGYANQYYAFVADGHILVQGSLLIAFKEAGYLLYPIQRTTNNSANIILNQEAGATNIPGSSLSPRYSIDGNGNFVNSYQPKDFSVLEAARAAENKRIMEANVEQMAEWQASGTFPKQQKRFNNVWRQLSALPDDKFEDWAETFEDSLWYGSDRSNPLVRDKLFSSNIKLGEHIEQEDVLQHRRADQYPEMDIFITYGDISRNPTNHTVKKILDVSFVGQSQQIEISGQPVYEVYNFIARNLV
jgi:hypothetical protein